MRHNIVEILRHLLTEYLSMVRMPGKSTRYARLITSVRIAPSEHEKFLPRKEGGRSPRGVDPEKNRVTWRDDLDLSRGSKNTQKSTHTKIERMGIYRKITKARVAVKACCIVLETLETLGFASTNSTAAREE